ncbi:MAG: hypothetical protein AAFQ87_17290 [Bacteroidota bacterium]
MTTNKPNTTQETTKPQHDASERVSFEDLRLVTGGTEASPESCPETS